MHMGKRSRLNIDPTEDDLDAWWKGLDLQSKHAVRASGVKGLDRAEDAKKLEDYMGKRRKFLQDLPKTVVDDWEEGRTVMHYVTHTQDMVIYNIVHQIAEDEENPVFDHSIEIIDSKTVAFFYANAGNSKKGRYPVARRTRVSDRLHRRCNTQHPERRHLVIQDRKGENFIDDGCWCNQFLWSLGFPVTEKF